MYLREVEMENFKSFNKRIKIPMLEGYTCVTGPNGSGKSNVSDAVLFVLGPKSSRVLRAGRLTDLIFNGGQREKRGARECKVSLTFDNHDRALPIETDDVRLTRVVKISDTAKLPDGGEGYNSYYYINGTKSSLSEFDNLLTQARISADGYNMVQQGDVGRIVSMGNVERRRILESIAGITKFDEDINKAETKKRDVAARQGQGLRTQVQDIQGEARLREGPDGPQEQRDGRERD
jgi:chromosome segregation protein